MATKKTTKAKKTAAKATKAAKAAKPKQKLAAKPKAKAAAPKRKRTTTKSWKAAKPRVPTVENALNHLNILVGAHPGLILEGAERATFARECPDLDVLVASYPDHHDLMVRVAFAYRKQARLDDAQRAADLALAVARTWEAVTAKAGVCRAADQIETAIDLFAEAAELDRGDTAALMEGAQTLGEIGRFADAAAWFGKVIDRDPEHDGARAWREYAAFLATRGPEHVAAMQQLAGTGNELAAELLADMEQRQPA